MCALCRSLGNIFFHFWMIPGIKVCTCVCQPEWVCPCLCEHASFSSPLAGTIACGEVLRSSQSQEQCEGRPVPQQEVVHAPALAGGGTSRVKTRTRWNAWHATVPSGFLQWKIIPNKTRKGESQGLCSPSSRVECQAGKDRDQPAVLIGPKPLAFSD